MAKKLLNQDSKRGEKGSSAAYSWGTNGTTFAEGRGKIREAAKKRRTLPEGKKTIRTCVPQDWG